MNSQQELIDVIKDIAKKQNHTYDTPATVLRVEGDTVWVHIDGGADETPVRKTINCEQGEIVQVRISNGSAFLVGNASAPPTDDKTAKVAHFVAEEAGVRAVEAQNTAAEAKERATIAQTAAAAAQAAVAQSLITYETWYKLSATTPTQPTEDSHEGWSTAEPAWSSSSTDKLYFSVRTVKGDGTATWSAVGMVQSYADLQILKNAIISTVASEYVAQGDSNVTELSSTMLQNAHGVNIYNDTLAVGDSYAHIDGDSFDIKEVTTDGQIDDENDEIIASFGKTVRIGKRSELSLEINDVSISFSSRGGALITIDTNYGLLFGVPAGHYAHFNEYNLNLQNKIGLTDRDNTSITSEEINICRQRLDAGNILYQEIKIRADGIYTDYGIFNLEGTRSLLPHKLKSEIISASATSYTFTDSVIKEESTIEVFDTISRFAYTDITAGEGSCTITFPAQGQTHSIELLVWD